MSRTLLIAAGLLSMSLGSSAQQPKEVPKEFILDEENGFKICKPPRAKEWEVKAEKDSNKKFSNSLAEVKCIIKDITVAVFEDVCGENEGFKPLPEIVTDMIEGMRKEETVSDVKERYNRDEKFPGKGGSKGKHFELQITPKEGQPHVRRYWLFITGGKRLFTIMIMGDEEAMNDKKKRYARDIQVILSTFEVLPRKKKK